MVIASFDGFFNKIPLITCYLGLSILTTTVLCSTHLLDPYYIIFNWPMVYKNRHFWRIFTNYFFVGKFSFNWIMLMATFVQFSTNLEHDTSFAHSKGAYLYFLFFQMCLISVFSIFFYWPTGYPFLFEALHFSIVYIWSKLNKYSAISIYFITVKGYQLPIILFIFHLLTGGSPINHIIGLLTGHLFYYIRDLVPNGPASRLVKTPRVFNTAVFSMEKLTNYVIKLFSEGPPRSNFRGRGSTLY